MMVNIFCDTIKCSPKGTTDLFGGIARASFKKFRRFLPSSLDPLSFRFRRLFVWQRENRGQVFFQPALVHLDSRQFLKALFDLLKSRLDYSKINFQVVHAFVERAFVADL